MSSLGLEGYQSRSIEWSLFELFFSRSFWDAPWNGSVGKLLMMDLRQTGAKMALHVHLKRSSLSCTTLKQASDSPGFVLLSGFSQNPVGPQIFFKEVKLSPKGERNGPHCVQTCSFLFLVIHRDCTLLNCNI